MFRGFKSILKDWLSIRKEKTECIHFHSRNSPDNMSDVSLQPKQPQMSGTHFLGTTYPHVWEGDSSRQSYSRFPGAVRGRVEQYVSGNTASSSVITDLVNGRVLWFFCRFVCSFNQCSWASTLCQHCAAHLGGIRALERDSLPCGPHVLAEKDRQQRW